jgi:hypothetical protein
MSQVEEHYTELIRTFHSATDSHGSLALIVLAASIERAAETIAQSINEIEVKFTTKKPFGE